MKRHTERHHRKPRSIGGDNTDRNISIVTSKQHDSWHSLFSNLPAEDIAKVINEKWLDPDYIFLPIWIGDAVTKEQIHTLIRKLQKAI